jgi:hypothetical protein
MPHRRAPEREIPRIFAARKIRHEEDVQRHAARGEDRMRGLDRVRVAVVEGEKDGARRARLRPVEQREIAPSSMNV